MTEIIDATLNTKQCFDRFASTSFQKIKYSHYSQSTSPNSQKSLQQKCFSVLIKQVAYRYDLFIKIDPTQFFTSIKINLVKKCGSILKIQQQKFKTYLIRKFIGLQNIYRFRICPLSGEIYFRLDYFELKQYKNSFSQNDAKSILKSLNLDKLYQTLQNFSYYYDQNQQYNSNENSSAFQKHYHELSKAICSINDSDFNDVLSFISQSKDYNNNQNPQIIKTQNLISQLHHFISSPKYTYHSYNKNLLEKQLVEIEAQSNNLGALTKRKQGKSNYQTLLINHTYNKQMSEIMTKMTRIKQSKESMKILQSQLGKVTLNLQKNQQNIYKAKLKFLLSLPRNVQYHFLDKYFKNQHNSPIIISLSLKEESLPRFLQVNSRCISMETKMRILLQICSAVHTLWQQRNIILYVSQMSSIHITKNLTIKVRNLLNYYKVQKHMMLQDKMKVNIRLIDNWLNLSEIYFRLFSGYNLAYVRPAFNNFKQAGFPQYSKAIIMRNNAVASKLTPEGFLDPTKKIIVGLNYIFLSFIDKAHKIVVQPYRKQKNKRQVFRKSQMNQNQPEKEQKQDNSKLLSYKLTCCWLFKNFELISKDEI